MIFQRRIIQHHAPARELFKTRTHGERAEIRQFGSRGTNADDDKASRRRQRRGFPRSRDAHGGLRPRCADFSGIPVRQDLCVGDGGSSGHPTMTNRESIPSSPCRMSKRAHLPTAVRWLAFTGSAAAAAYATYAGVTWLRYGHVNVRPATNRIICSIASCRPTKWSSVITRRVAAPADVTLEVAATMELFQRPLVRAIFKGRELILGATPDERSTAPRTARGGSGAGVGRARRDSRA